MELGCPLGDPRRRQPWRFSAPIHPSQGTLPFDFYPEFMNSTEAADLTVPGFDKGATSVTPTIAKRRA
jgi:hypothetical protein